MNLIKQLYFRWKIKYQKKIALEVLNKLQAYDSNVILAGGAPRDWMFGKPAKDLDVYLKYSDVDRLIETVEYLGLRPKKIAGNDLPKNYITDYLQRVIDVRYKFCDVQIMVGNIPTSQVIDKFDLSISQICMSKTGTIRASTNFDQGLKDKTIRVISSRLGSNSPYCTKIKQKFPSWKFENPYELIVTGDEFI